MDKPNAARTILPGIVVATTVFVADTSAPARAVTFNKDKTSCRFCREIVKAAIVRGKWLPCHFSLIRTHVRGPRRSKRPWRREKCRRGSRIPITATLPTIVR